MLKRNQPETGYAKKKPKKDHKERKYLSDLIIPFGKKISFKERMLKFIIYIALRIVIKPSRWKKPDKNLEIIDRTYNKITSSDFVFIPSSVAFYWLMAFIPLITMIALMTKISIFKEVDMVQNLREVFHNFIPGLDQVWTSLSEIKFSAGAYTGIATFIISSLWISASGFSRLIYTQSHLYGHKYGGAYWMNKLKGVLIVLFFSLILFLALTVNLFFIQAIKKTPWSPYYHDLAIKIFLYFGLLMLILLSYVALYKLSSSYPIKIRHIIPGAMVATVPTMIFIAIFGILSKNLSYQKFGYIGTFLYVGLLVLEISYFTFVGLIVNVSYYQTFVSKEQK